MDHSADRYILDSPEGFNHCIGSTKCSFLFRFRVRDKKVTLRSFTATGTSNNNKLPESSCSVHYETCGWSLEWQGKSKTKNDKNTTPSIEKRGQRGYSWFYVITTTAAAVTCWGWENTNPPPNNTLRIERKGVDAFSSCRILHSVDKQDNYTWSSSWSLTDWNTATVVFVFWKWSGPECIRRMQ